MARPLEWRMKMKPTIICKRIDVKGRPDGGQRKYNRDLAAYMANPEKDGAEKCVKTFSWGFTREDMTPAEIAAELTMDCDLARDVNSGKVDHWVLSFSEHEGIALSKVRDTVEGWLEDMGYARYHKCYACVHLDTDNLHCHIALCRVNFLTGRLKYRQMWKLDNQRALVRAAKAEGWRLEEGSDYFRCPANTRPEPVAVVDPVFGTKHVAWRPKAVRTRHRDREAPHPGDRASRLEHFKGVKSLKTMQAERLKGVLDELPENPEWADVHEALAKRGVVMELREHGKRKGLALSFDGQSWIGASKVSRGLSWGLLKGRVNGGFIPASLEIIKIADEQRARLGGFHETKVEKKPAKPKADIAASFRESAPGKPDAAAEKARIESLKKRNAQKQGPAAGNPERRGKQEAPKAPERPKQKTKMGM